MNLTADLTIANAAHSLLLIRPQVNLGVRQIHASYYYIVLRFQFHIATLCVGLLASTACAVVRRGPRAVTVGAHWTCAAPASVERYLGFVRDYTAPQSEFAERYRVQINLPRVPTESVTVVTAPEICERAGLAYARDGSQHLSPGVYEMAVIRAGNRYIVRGVTAPSPAGEWNISTVFDLRFHAIIGILGP